MRCKQDTCYMVYDFYKYEWYVYICVVYKIETDTYVIRHAADKRNPRKLIIFVNVYNHTRITDSQNDTGNTYWRL